MEGLSNTAYRGGNQLDAPVPYEQRVRRLLGDSWVVSFWHHSLKDKSRCKTRGSSMQEAVFEYIEVDYNRARCHSANGYISPEAFETHKVA